MIVIVDYDMGNLFSVQKAFKRIGADIIVSNKEEEVMASDKIVLPGVGHFKKGMNNLSKLNLIRVLNQKVVKNKTPILGICLGMQLFTEFSEEGNINGLGWIKGKTFKLNLNRDFKVPHMGWNNLIKCKKSNLLLDINNKDLFYFVHSFFVKCNEKEDILTETNYCNNFVSSIEKNNLYGVQFHPEKSHDSGIKLLKNFANNIK